MEVKSKNDKNKNNPLKKVKIKNYLVETKKRFKIYSEET